MKGDQTRLELFVDVLDRKDQRALAEPELTPAELLTAILDEFRELEYLSSSPTDYRLLKAEDHSPLNDILPLNQQVANRARLVVAESELPLPRGTQRPTQRVYLRDEAAGRVYRITWYPAIIGRPDPTLAHNEWIAVNMAGHSQGQSVSRRHARITEEEGAWYIESLSPNKTTIQHELGTNTLDGSDKYVVKHGDVIYLDQSQISLKFIVRSEEEKAL